MVRLGASGGITTGRAARILFTPIAVTDRTDIQISGVLLADLSGETYTADQLDGIIHTDIQPAQLFLPLVVRAP